MLEEHGRAIFAENLRDRIIKVRLSKNGNTPQNCHVSMGEDDEWCDGEPYFQTFNLRFGSKVSLHPLWIRSNLYPSCDQKNRFTNPILCFFHLWTQYLKPLYVYIIYIYQQFWMFWLLVSVRDPPCCWGWRIYNTNPFLPDFWPKFSWPKMLIFSGGVWSEGQSCQWRHLQMHPRAAGVGTQGYCRWPKWQPGD